MTFDAADGYLLLFGGEVLNASGTSGGVSLNDTWSFSGGVWTNLSIPGPSAGGGAAVAYDPSAGCVLLFGGVGNNHTSLPGNPLYLSAQTWEFSKGHWTLLPAVGPGARSGASMVYDAADGYVLMWGGQGYSASDGNQTWAFEGGAWNYLGTGGPDATGQDGDVPMAYDAALGAVVLADETPALGSNATWEFATGKWRQLEAPPPYLQWPAMTYDPIDGLLVMIGGASPLSSNAGHSTNQTWAFSAGQWSNLGVPGPPPRTAPGMTFDPVEGALVLFGGEDLWDPPPASGNGNFGDTWEFAGAPVNVSLGIVVSPTSICSVNAPTCPAGTVDAQVTVSVEVVTPSPNGGGAAGIALQYGPFHWLDVPSLRFEPWQNVTVVSGLPVTTTCTTSWGPTNCPSPTRNTSGLSWMWEGSGPDVALVLGDSWSASFYVQIAGPHPHPVPVDACVATGCGAAGSGAIAGMYTWLEFAPWGTSSEEELSFLPATVTVLPVSSTESGPSSTAPPPPPGIGPTLPVPPVTVPTPVTTPSPLSAVSSGVTNIPLSLQAAAAGILAVGGTRIALRPSPVRQGVLLRQRTGPGSRTVSAGRFGQERDVERP